LNLLCVTIGFGAFVREGANTGILEIERSVTDKIRIVFI
jgi:hypothetical protein